MNLVLSSKLFTWTPLPDNKFSGTFTAEASELESVIGRSRLDYQNGEWGFYMQSHRTGQNLWFKRTKEYVDADGDLVLVEFWSKNPSLKLLVFND